MATVASRQQRIEKDASQTKIANRKLLYQISQHKYFPTTVEKVVHHQLMAPERLALSLGG